MVTCKMYQCQNHVHTNKKNQSLINSMISNFRERQPGDGEASLNDDLDDDDDGIDNLDEDCIEGSDGRELLLLYIAKLYYLELDGSV